MVALDRRGPATNRSNHCPVQNMYIFSFGCLPFTCQQATLSSHIYCLLCYILNLLDKVQNGNSCSTILYIYKPRCYSNWFYLFHIFSPLGVYKQCTKLISFPSRPHLILKKIERNLIHTQPENFVSLTFRPCLTFGKREEFEIDRQPEDL